MYVWTGILVVILIVISRYHPDLYTRAYSPSGAVHKPGNSKPNCSRAMLCRPRVAVRVTPQIRRMFSSRCCNPVLFSHAVRVTFTEQPSLVDGIISGRHETIGHPLLSLLVADWLTSLVTTNIETLGNHSQLGTAMIPTAPLQLAISPAGYHITGHETITAWHPDL